VFEELWKRFEDSRDFVMVDRKNLERIIDVNGNTQVIYPTSASDNNFIRVGQTRRIPDNTRFRLGPPFGEEIILAAAYDRPFTPGQQSGGTLSADTITRALTVESDNHSTTSPSATAKFSYTILPRL
jgi:hypothetical protein